MNVYTVSDNTSFDRHWTTAASIHSRSRMVKWSCSDCGTSASYPAGAFDVTIEGGMDYPDCLGCGVYPLKIFSERVIAAWEENGIGPLVKFPIGVIAARETALSPRDAPRYFRVEVAGAIMVDIPGSGGFFTRLCARCGTFMTEPMLIRTFAFHAGSWDGSSLFRDQRILPRVVFCTEAVKVLSEVERHTNCRFEAMVPTSDP